MRLFRRQLVERHGVKRVKEAKVVHRVLTVLMDLPVIPRYKTLYLLQKELILGVFPRQQRHACEEGRSPVADVEKALRVAKIVAVHRPRKGPWVVRQALDVRARFADAQIESPTKL